MLRGHHYRASFAWVRSRDCIKEVLFLWGEFVDGLESRKSNVCVFGCHLRLLQRKTSRCQEDHRDWGRNLNGRCILRNLELVNKSRYRHLVIGGGMNSKIWVFGFLWRPTWIWIASCKLKSQIFRRSLENVLHIIYYFLTLRVWRRMSTITSCWNGRFKKRQSQASSCAAKACS